MLTNKKRWFALALVAAMLFTSVNPLTAHAEDAVATATHNHGTLTVTKDFMDEGVVTLEDADWDEIVIPAELGATKVVMKNVVAAKVVIEDTTFCDVEISGGSINKMEVAKQESEITLRDLAKLIASGMKKAEAQKTYQKDKQELAEKKAQTPAIVIKDKAVVKALTVTGSEGKMALDGFTGKLVVEQTAKSGNGYGVLELELKNSNPSKVEISGESQNSLVVTGTNSTIAEAVVEGSGSLVLDVETKKLETAKDSESVALVVLAAVEEAVINGKATGLTIASDVVVKKAVINGDDAKVDGNGKLESAAVSNESADVKTEGTDVYDPAKVTATPVPTVAPTTAPSYGGGGGSSWGDDSWGDDSWDDDYWDPTYEPTATPSPTATPIPEATPEPEPEVHKHDWNVETATCVTAKQCKDETCGYIEEAATGIHEFAEEGVVTAPTCTANGYTTYKCKYCDETKKDTIVAPTGHKVATWTIGAAVADKKCTYTQNGVCTVCGETQTSATNVTKHSSDMIVGIATPATCQTAGVKTYTCKECGVAIAQENYTNADAHAWDNGTTEGNKFVYRCTVNGCTATKSEVVMTDAGIEAAALDKNTEVKTITGVLVALDDAVLQQVQNEGTASGAALKLSAGVLDDTAKTAAVAGLSEEAKAQIGDTPIYDLNMSVNDGAVSQFNGKVTVRIPYTLAEGEDPDSVVVWYLPDGATTAISVQGTYYNGLVSFETDHFSYYTVVRMTPAERCALFNQHLMLSATTNPTCTEDGYITSICQRCGKTEVTPGQKATGHNIVVEVIEEATCQHMGKDRHKCNNKNCPFYTEVNTPKGNHKPKEKENGRHEATCLKDGYVEYECDCGYHKNEPIKAQGHKKGQDGKCTVCGAKVNCKHENKVTLVKLADGAATCLDGVVCTDYCLLCENALKEWTVKDEHCYGVVNLINLYPYSANTPGYIRESGCACGERGNGFYRSNELYNGYGDWVMSKRQYTDEAGKTHTVNIWSSASTKIRVEGDDCELFREGCGVTTDRVFRVYMDEKQIAELGGTMVAESHAFGYTSKLLEGSKTCADGVEVTEFCMRCDTKFGTWVNTWCTESVIKYFSMDKYSDTSCGGVIAHKKCPCGVNESIFSYYGPNTCNLKASKTNSKMDETGKLVYTTTRSCDICGFKTEDTYTLDPLGDCRATRNGTLTIMVNGVVKESHEYSCEVTNHDTYNTVELAEGSTSCLDGVVFTSHCWDCGKIIGSWTSTTKHSLGTKQIFDASKYGVTCGNGKFQWLSCACGEYQSIGLPRGCMLDGQTTTQVDASGLEHKITNWKCRNCEVRYVQDKVMARNAADCTAVTNYTYQLYFGETLVGTFAYTVKETAHNIYNSEVILNEGSVTCEDGVTRIRKCRDCDYTVTDNNIIKHERAEIAKIDLSELGATCGGYVSVTKCACGEYVSSNAVLNCETNWQWNAMLQPWCGQYRTIQTNSEGKAILQRAVFNCAVTDPKCGLNLILERRTEWITPCYATTTVYLCVGQNADGTYQAEYPVNISKESNHKIGQCVESYDTDENGVALKLQTYNCQDCGEGYKETYIYADYLEDKSYSYIVEHEVIDSIMNSGSRRIVDYTFGASGCSSVLKYANLDGTVYNVSEPRPACAAKNILTDMSCTQLATGVCDKCKNINMLGDNGPGSIWAQNIMPWSHSFVLKDDGSGYVCVNCNMESEKGQSGNIVLEDRSDDTNYIAGYWNQGKLVFGVFVYLITADGTQIQVELSPTLSEAFYIGTATLEKAKVDAWAQQKGYTDYDVMFSFIPKNASMDNSYNVVFTE